MHGEAQINTDALWEISLAFQSPPVPCLPPLISLLCLPSLLQVTGMSFDLYLAYDTLLMRFELPFW